MIVGVLLDGRQRHAEKLRTTAAAGGGDARAAALAAEQQQLLAVGGPLGAARRHELVGGDHLLLAGRQFLDPHVDAKQFVGLGVGDPFAIGRELRLPDVAALGGGQHFFLAGVDVHAAQLVVGAGPQERLGIGGPHDGVLVAIRVAEFFGVLAELVGDEDLFAAGAVGDVGDPLAVGGPARILLLPRGLADALDFAAIGGDGEDLAVHHDGRPLVRRRDVEAFDFVVDGHELGLVVLQIALDVDADLDAFAAGGIELPDAEVVLVDDNLAVGGDAGEEEVAIAVMRDLDRLAALIGDLPDVVFALHHFGRAGLDGLLVGQLVGDEVDLAALAVHGPEHVALIILVAELGELLGGEFLDPQVRRVGAAIVLARPDAGVTGEGELLAVGRIAGVGAPIGIHGPLDPAFDGHFPEGGDGGECAVAADGGEDDFLAVGGPADHVVIGAVEGDLARFAAGHRDNVDVVVALAIRGEGDPLAIG